MKIKSRPLWPLFAGMLVSGMAQTAPSYTFTQLDTLGAEISFAFDINNSGQVVGATNHGAVLWNGSIGMDISKSYGMSWSNGINDTGQIAGYTSTATTGYNASWWNGTTTTFLGSLGGSYSEARAINNLGQIVGQSQNSDGNGWVATLWNGAAATALKTLGGQDGLAWDINNKGQVVGYSSVADNSAYHATLWDGATVTDLGTLGETESSIAQAINDAGHVVGYSYTFGTSGVHAFLWDGKKMTEIGTLGGALGEPSDINNADQIVGTSTLNGETVSHATLWEGTTVTDLNNLLDAKTVADGWVLRNASSINDKGWIVGSAVNSSNPGTEFAFLLTPDSPVFSVSEPESCAMLLAGLGLMSVIARRRTGKPQGSFR